MLYMTLRFQDCVRASNVQRENMASADFDTVRAHFVERLFKFLPSSAGQEDLCVCRGKSYRKSTPVSCSCSGDPVTPAAKTFPTLRRETEMVPLPIPRIEILPNAERGLYHQAPREESSPTCCSSRLTVAII